MGLYRRLGELEDRQAIDAFAAEMIDRSARSRGNREPDEDRRGEAQLPKAMIAKLDIGPKGAVVTFARRAASPISRACSAYIDRLKGAAKLRPDSKLA